MQKTLNLIVQRWWWDLWVKSLLPPACAYGPSETLLKSQTHTKSEKKYVLYNLIYWHSIKKITQIKKNYPNQKNYYFFIKKITQIQKITMIFWCIAITCFGFCLNVLLKVWSHLLMHSKILLAKSSHSNRILRNFVHFPVDHVNPSSWPTESDLVWKWFLCEQCFIHLYAIDIL